MASTEFLCELLCKTLGWANRLLCFLYDPAILGETFSLLLDVVFLADGVILLRAEFLIVVASLGHCVAPLEISLFPPGMD